MAAILKRYVFYNFLSADNHKLTYSTNGANFIPKFHWESGFLKEGGRGSLHQRVGNTLVTQVLRLKPGSCRNYKIVSINMEGDHKRLVSNSMDIMFKLQS